MIKSLGKYGAIAVLLGTTPAMANDFKVVRDKQGDPVRSNLAGTCVLTKWKTDNNICGVDEPQRITVRSTTFGDAERTVYFGFDKASLASSEKRKLKDLANKARNSGEVYDGTVVGYADEIGDTAYNKALSERRARNVKDYLEDTGLSVKAVDVRSRGEIASSDCDGLDRDARINCLSDDRRVEVELELRDNKRFTFFR